jgi:alpha-beta hydrolase superfamily lysophospholipase
MTNLQEFTFLSSDGKTSLHGMEWLPEGRDIIGVLQIAHGVSEHISRYDGFARFLNEQGLAVVGHDHLGHGGSIPEGGTPVYFGKGNTWNTVVDDVYALHLRLREEFPGKPLFLMGHSMGSFVARTYLIRYPGTVRAAIIMGTGWQPEMMLTGGLTVAKLVSRRSGEDCASDFVNNLAFGAYNKAFAPNRTPVDWLSADTDNVDRYIADPFCGQPATAGLFREMLTGIRFNQRTDNLRKMDKDMPVLLISGEKDPVGDMMKGVIRTRDAFQAAGMKDVTLMSYAGLRHEILNEKAQQQTVYNDIWAWLKKYC